MSNKRVLPEITFDCYGNASNEPIVFIHGWPDIGSLLWKDQITFFKENYYCIVIDLPNYNIDKGLQNKWGYDFPFVSESINIKVESILKKSEYNQAILFIHDWGSIVGSLCYKLKPLLYQRIIMIDVGDGGRNKELSFTQKLIIVMYQYWNILAFLIPLNFIGNGMTKFGCWVLKTPIYKYAPNKIHAGMNYMYYYLWKRMLFNKASMNEIRLKSFPEIPLYFGFGMKNPLKFYSNKFIKNIDSRNDCDYKGYNASHWVMIDKKDELNKDIQKWLNDTNKFCLKAKM